MVLMLPELRDIKLPRSSPAHHHSLFHLPVHFLPPLPRIIFFFPLFSCAAVFSRRGSPTF